jgi:integral membrane protein (TIGR00529 family)
MVDLLKLLVVFVAIVIALNKRADVGATLLAGAVALGLLMGRPPQALALDVWSALTSFETIRLIVVVLLILTLTGALKAARLMESMVRALLELISDARVVIGVVPALTGLLPMPGGAMFSAPMVEEISHHFSVNANQKTFANYWFRHVWEYVMPLYPGLILCAALLSIPVSAFMRNQWPLTLAAIVFGGIVIWAHFPKDSISVARTDRRKSLLVLLRSIWPVLLVVVATMAFDVDLLITLPLTLLLLSIVARFSWAQMLSVLRRGLDWHIALVLLGAMVFKQVMGSTGIVEQVSDTLGLAGVPPVALIAVIPFIVGLATGVTTAAFSISVPVVLPFLMVGGSLHLPYVVLMYAGGMTGLMLSPVHLCMILTRAYFGSEWWKTMKPVLFSQTLVLAVAIALTALGS